MVSSFHFGICLLALTAILPNLDAQQLEERSLPLEIAPLTREELDRHQADQLVREAQTLYGVGILRQREDRLLEALSLLEKAVRIDPRAAEPRRALIPIYLALSRTGEAREACRQVLERDSADGLTAYELAKLLKLDNRPREAMTVLATGVESPRLADQPDKLFPMLKDLAELRDKENDSAGCVVTLAQLTALLKDRKARLINSGLLTSEEHALEMAHAYELLGQCELKRQHYNDALKAYMSAQEHLEAQADKAVRKEADHLSRNLAEVFFAQDKFDVALAYLDSYLDHHPGDTADYERKAELMRKLGRGGEVIHSFEVLASGKPKHLPVQLALARELARDSRRRPDAETLYERLAQQFPKPELYRAWFHLDLDMKQMRKVIDLLDATHQTVSTPNELEPALAEAARVRLSAMLSALRADATLVSGLLDAEPEEVLGSRDRSLDTRRLLASLAARAHQLDKAERLYRQCLIGIPQPLEIEVYARLLEVLQHAHKQEAIIVICKELLYGKRKLNGPNVPIIQGMLAWAYASQGKPEAALAEIDKAIAVAAADGKFHARCMRARFLAYEEKYEQAVKECKSLLAESTGKTDRYHARLALAEVLAAHREDSEAEKVFREILEEFPDDAQVNNNLGYHLAERNRDLDDAEKLIRRAIASDKAQRHKDGSTEPENAAYLDSLGWVLFRKGLLEEARTWLEKAAALPAGAEDPSVQDHLGDVYYRMNEPLKAKRAWQNSARCADSDPRGKRDGRAEEVRRKLKLVE